MKKVIILTIICCAITSYAYADLDTDLYFDYNSWARTFHAPQLDKDNLTVVGNHYFFDVGNMKIVFEVSLTGSIRTGFIFMDDESCTADFLTSCIVMITFFNKLGFDYYGTLLEQFIDIRMGKETAPYNLGIDAFQITTSEKGKYSFVFLNNDAKLSY